MYASTESRGRHGAWHLELSAVRFACGHPMEGKKYQEFNSTKLPPGRMCKDCAAKLRKIAVTRAT